MAEHHKGLKEEPKTPRFSLETWTEPCAVVDSLILALELYRITKEDRYRVLARRIWFNGLQFCQRPNGGVGPNTCVDKNNPYLQRGQNLLSYYR